MIFNTEIGDAHKIDNIDKYMWVNNILNKSIDGEHL